MHPSGRHANEASAARGPMPEPVRYGPAHDELSDSGVLRLATATRVRLHTYKGEPVEVSMGFIRGVTTWEDVAAKVMRCEPIELVGPHRMAFAGGVVLWADVSTDPA